MFDLPLGLQLSLPIAEYYSTRIGRIEGFGVQPDIEIDKSLSLKLAMSLAHGEAPNVALSKLEAEMIEMEGQPLGGEVIYLFGSMNNWGNIKDDTPKFDYMGNGVYETQTSLEKGQYEFKVASANWSIDFGANIN